MRKRSLPLLLAISTVVIQVASALAQPPAQSADSAAVQAELAARPRIGLVLSGGGARGAAHVGVLKVLEELRIPVDAIAGTSMGAIVGGLYASGMSPDTLEKTLSGVDWGRALTDRSARDLLSYRRKQDDIDLAMQFRVGLKGWKPSLPLGLIQGQRLEMLLRSLVVPVATVKDFDQLVHPFRAVAADLATTRAVVLGEGDLVTAMRASMSVPAVFAPVPYENGLLIDGGVADNLPVDVVRKMNVDVVIAVDIGTQLAKLEDLGSAYAVNDQMLTGLMRRETERQLASLGPADITIVPDLGKFTSADFLAAARIMPLGEAAARTAAERLRRLSLSAAAWKEYRSGLRRFTGEPPTVAGLKIVQDSDLSDEYVASLVTVQPGQKLDQARLGEDIQRVYGLDRFSKVGYELADAGPGRVDLGIAARRREWGVDYMQFGLALHSNLANAAAFDFHLRLNKLAASSSGGEWRTDLRVGQNQLLASEYYQPFGGARSFFWAPRIVVRRQPLVLLSEGDEVGIFRLRAAGAAVDVGRAMGNWGELRLGFERLNGSLRQEAGTQLPGSDLDEGRFYVRFGTDTYDNSAFPRAGAQTFTDVGYSAQALGATDDLGRGSLVADKATSWGRHTLLFGVEAGGFFDDTKIGFPYSLGGFGRLSGLGEGSIAGRYLALARVMYYARVKRLGLAAIDMPIYVGGSVELGNTWLKWHDVDPTSLLLHGSLFAGLDTPLGPVYFGAGFGEQDRRAAFFFLGRSF